MNPLISVIIPTYNRQSTILRAVNSVLAQTYTNYEIIIIDDASTDDTEAIIQKLYSANSKIHYYRNEYNLGAGSSRNIGVSHSKGSYIAFQDSDDEWLPQKLTLQTKALALHSSCNIVYSVMKRFYLDNSFDFCPPDDMPVDMKSGYIFKSLLMGPFIGMPTALIEKNCFLSSGGFDTSIPVCEDYALFLSLARNGEVILVDEPLVYVYDTKESLNKNEIAKFETQMQMIEKYLSSYIQFDLLSAKLGAMLTKAMDLNIVPLFQNYLKKIELRL